MTGYTLGGVIHALLVIAIIVVLTQGRRKFEQRTEGHLAIYLIVFGILGLV